MGYWAGSSPACLALHPQHGDSCPNRGHGARFARKWFKFLKRRNMNREGTTWISPGHSWLCWAFDQLTQHWGNSQQILLSPRCSQLSPAQIPPGLLKSASVPGHNQNQFLRRELVCRNRLLQGTKTLQGNFPSKPRNLWVFSTHPSSGCESSGNRQ